VASILALLVSLCKALEEPEYKQMRWNSRAHDRSLGMMDHGRMRGMPGGGDGGGGMMQHNHGGADMGLIHNLFDHREQIERSVNVTEAGAETYTGSDDPEVSQWIQAHVAQMIALVGSDEGMIREWDPLFSAIFEHKDALTATLTSVDDKGVHVTLEGTTPCGKSLAHLHAKVVSNFIKRGYPEMHESHEVPTECDDE